MEQFLNPHEYMFQFDIKQGYHHIDIYKSQQKFLGLNHHEESKLFWSRLSINVLLDIS